MQAIEKILRLAKFVNNNIRLRIHNAVKFSVLDPKIWILFGKRNWVNLFGLHFFKKCFAQTDATGDDQIKHAGNAGGFAHNNQAASP